MVGVETVRIRLRDSINYVDKYPWNLYFMKEVKVIKLLLKPGNKRWD